jgi:hypothetical protein
VPAAAVIPAPIAYIKVVAVKTLVVEILPIRIGHLFEIVLVIIGIDPKHLIVNSVKCSEQLL